jgi:DnaJ-class molecular chaperone
MFSFESGPISDPYYILEVPRTATIKEVKKAYFHKAKKYHPDLNPNNESAKKMFIEI